MQNFLVKKHSKSEFYDTFIKWSDMHKFPRVNELVLPENVFVCYNEDDEAVYSCWFYFTDSKLAWIAFPMSNKEVAYNKRDKGLDFLFKHIIKYAKNKKMHSIITTSSTKEVIHSMSRVGFVEADLNVNQYLKVI